MAAVAGPVPAAGDFILRFLFALGVLATRRGVEPLGERVKRLVLALLGLPLMTSANCLVLAVSDNVLLLHDRLLEPVEEMMEIAQRRAVDALFDGHA